MIGPEDSIQKILNVNQHLDNKLDLIPYVYDDIKEVPNLVKENLQRVKGWLFSGPTPFMLSKDILGGLDNVVYCSFTGAGLYKCLLQIANQQKTVLNRLSIDIPQTENLKESIDDLGIPLRDIYINEFDGSDVQALIDFHYDLWKSGKTETAISSLGSVYKALLKKGVPVYRNTVTIVTIREALMILSEKITASYFRDTQVGFQIFEIRNFDQVVEKVHSQYELQLLELKIKKDLIRLSKNLNGYLSEKGQGRYEIFSSRGAIERELDSSRKTVQKISHDIDAPISVGIGFGSTVSSAEINARRAILNATKRKTERIIIIQEDGLLIESSGDNGELVYEDYSDDTALIQKLHKAKVGVKTYKRIQATVQQLGWDSFTSSQLSEELSASERNIRRVINCLCEIGLVEYIGEGYSAARGRPSKVYRLIENAE